MGVDYSANLALGYEVSQEQLDRFKVRIDPVWHMEARWNPKTGEKLPDEKVIIQEASFVYRWNGAEYDYPEDLVNDICNKIGAVYHTNMEYYGDCDDVEYIIGPRLKHDEDYDGISIGKLDVYGRMPWQNFMKLGEELNRIGQELLKMGIIKTAEQGIPYVTVVGSEH